MAAKGQKKRLLTEIDALKHYFADLVPPPGPVRLSACEVIIDPKKFIEASLEIIENEKLRKPYLARLILFKQIISNDLSRDH